MFKSYFIIACRNLARNKSYTAINIIGLGVGIAACILIGLFVYNEISFDNNVPDKAQIYRLNEYVHYDGTAPQLSAAIGPPIAPFLKNNHQEIEDYTRVFPATPFIYPSITLEYNGKKITTSQMACTDTSFAGMFNTKIIEGDKSNFIRIQNSIVLTQSLAYKIFGKIAALNKMLALHTGDSTIYVAVSNVIADFPKTSHLQVEGLLPVPRDFENGFLGTNYGVLLGPSYLKLKPGININTFQAKLTHTIHDKNQFIDMRLQPLEQVHSQSTDINYDYFNYKKIDGKYIAIFIAIALAIFIIACINFINLTIAIAGYRGKEIAIKKIVGAKRVQIILQIITETFLSVFIALLLSILLAAVFLPYLNNILNGELGVNTLYQLNLLGIYTIILLITTFLAGSYPAWLISSSKINNALKSKILFGRSRTSLRNVLVTGQFTIAVIFIVGMVVFLRQLRFLQRKDLGYSYNQVIKVPLDIQSALKLPVMRSELLKIKGVTDITYGFMELGGNGSLFGISYVAPGGENKRVSVNLENAATNYVQFFGMKIIAGRDFNKDNSVNEYLINEALAKQIGYSNPVGKQINLADLPPGIIAGVVKDFNYSSLHMKIEPLLISSVNDRPVWKSQLYIKISTAEISHTLKEVETTFKSISGNSNIGFEFLDEHFKEMYNAEKEAGTMVAIVGGLAISIACLGLFSLAAFIIVKRTKEIGIRKVVGASVNNIAVMLSKDFIKPVFIAILIAFPVAWWTMNIWLQSFAYRITIGPGVFLIAGVSIILISLLTVSFQAIKAAFANPVKSLRSE
ncbi:MAG: FtsX-like permease family protein [Ginsengibacter sp.]